MSATTVKLVSMDDQEIVVERAVAERAVTIKNILDDLGDAAATEPVPLPNVRGAMLAKVVEYLTHHATTPAAAGEPGVTSEWDAAFCNVEQSVLFELILAANYLDVAPLLDLTCKTVAGMIKGKSPAEIRTMFNIVNDFTPEEEEQVRAENEWCEER